MESEKWFERLDRLLAEHAAEAATANAKSAGKEKERKGNSDTELITKCDKAFDTAKQLKRKVDADALTLRVLQSGTLTDRVAAMALVIGEEPLQSTGELEKLVKMCSSKGRREASLAMDAMRDLLLESLLPPARRLSATKTSFTRIADRNSVSDEILALIKYEDILKSQVWAFVRALEHATKDELSHHKITAMRRAADLLQERPEQERFLLSLLCSKMGDPDLKAAAQASHLLRRVANAHPQMRAVMVAELEASILSSAASPTYTYEAAIFLNQTILRRGDSELAEKLISIYFALFEKSLGIFEAIPENVIEKHEKKQLKKKNRSLNRKVAEAKKGVNSKLMAALLTGINRALPFTDSEDEQTKAKLQQRCDQLHRVVKQTESFHNATQALSLLFRLEKDRERYNRALSSKILDPALIDGKKTAFLNLVYRSLKSDSNKARMIKTLKLLLGVALKSSAAFAAGALFLLSNLAPVHPAVFDDLLGEEVGVQEASETSENVKSSKTSSLGNVVGEVEQIKPKSAAGAEPAELPSTVAWELEAFRMHYHPTVQAFARRILDREIIEYDGDPLHDFSLTAFLDRFVYRNPKEKRQAEDASGPAKVFGSKGREQRLGARVANEMPVNSEAFHEKYSGHKPKVGEETERFFFRYFDHLKKQGHHLAQGAPSGRDVDREDEEDAFADKLVDDLLKKKAGGFEADLDEEDFLAEYSPPEDNDEEDYDEEDGDIDAADDKFEAALGSDDIEEDDEDDEDEDDDEFLDEEESDEEAGGAGKYSLYADADDFAGLLEDASEDEDGEDGIAKWKKAKGKQGKVQKKLAGGSKPPSKKQRRH